MGILASIIGGTALSAGTTAAAAGTAGAATAGTAATTAATAGTAATAASAAAPTMSLTTAANMGWSPSTVLEGMSFGSGSYTPTTEFGGAGAAEPGLMGKMQAFSDNQQDSASMPGIQQASTGSAPGISTGSFDMGGSMLGDVSMNRGLSGQLGQEAMGSIASTASKFKNNIAQVPGIRI